MSANRSTPGDRRPGGCQRREYRPISAISTRRWTGTRRMSRRTAAISATTRRAAGLPDRHRHSALHPPDPDGNPIGAAETILSANILGGMCARVCPTETLCEEACVRKAAEGKPVRIGLLQRYATDVLLAPGEQPFTRARRPASGSPSSAAARPGCPARTAGPAGHDVDDVRGAPQARAASTNTASPPTRRSTTSPRREVDFILSIGGIDGRDAARRSGETSRPRRR